MNGQESQQQKQQPRLETDLKQAPQTDRAETVEQRFRSVLLNLFNSVHGKRLLPSDARKQLHAWWHKQTAADQAALAKENLAQSLSAQTKAPLDELHGEVPLLLSQVKAPESDQT